MQQHHQTQTTNKRRTSNGIDRCCLFKVTTLKRWEEFNNWTGAARRQQEPGRAGSMDLSRLSSDFYLIFFGRTFNIHWLPLPSTRVKSLLISLLYLPSSPFRGPCPFFYDELSIFMFLSRPFTVPFKCHPSLPTYLFSSQVLCIP